MPTKTCACLRERKGWLKLLRSACAPSLQTARARGARANVRARGGGRTDRFSWHGTSFEKVLHSPLYWMLVGCHWLLFWLRELDPTKDPLSDDPILKVGRIKYYMDANWVLTLGDIGALSSLATFFIVFYAGNCFGRYSTMYNSVVAIQGKMHNISLYVRVYFQQPTNRWTVIRYLLASHFIFYWSLRRRYYDWKNSQVRAKSSQRVTTGRKSSPRHSTPLILPAASKAFWLSSIQKFENFHF